jgi:hypothetical protein
MKPSFSALIYVAVFLALSSLSDAAVPIWGQCGVSDSRGDIHSTDHLFAVRP